VFDFFFPFFIGSGNTQIGDFLGALEHGAASVGRSFDPVAWSASFLETAGLNSVSADLKLSADGHKIQSLTLVQAASSDHPTIREHLLELGVYDLVGTQAKLRVKHEVRLSATDARVEVAALAGQPAPAFLFANHDDHAYLKIELDSKSRAFALKNIGALQEPLTRQLGWQSLWNACRDAQLSAIDYLALAREQVACETDPQVLGFILTTASGASANYIPNRLVAAENDKMFDALLPRLQAATNDNKPLQVTLADQLIAFASTSRAVSQLVSFLQPNAAIGTYVLGQAQRWRVVVRAAAHALDVEGALLKAECLRDRTDTGLRAASTARWAVPDAQVKKAAWSRWHSKEAYEKMSTYELLAEMSGFGHGFPHQAELMAPYIEPFFAEVREVYRDRSKGYHDAFFDHLFPFNPESDQVQALSAKLLASLDDSLDAMLKRSLKEQIDALDRARACRKVVGF
jgi:aminopeptidase N